MMIPAAEEFGLVAAQRRRFGRLFHDRIQRSGYERPQQP
jgi:hypothetical protein